MQLSILWQAKKKSRSANHATRKSNKVKTHSACIIKKLHDKIQRNIFMGILGQVKFTVFKKDCM